MSTKRLVASMLVLGLSCFLVGLTPSDASAEEDKKKQDAELIAELHTIHTTIHSANHNYKGHRVKAMAEVHHAVRQLGGVAGKKGAGKKAPMRAAGKKGAPMRAAGKKGSGGKRGKNALPQAESDARLKTAKEALAGVLTELSALPEKPHRTKSMTHIKHAMGALDKALAVR